MVRIAYIPLKAAPFILPVPVFNCHPETNLLARCWSACLLDFIGCMDVWGVFRLPPLVDGWLRLGYDTKPTYGANPGCAQKANWIQLKQPGFRYPRHSNQDARG